MSRVGFVTGLAAEAEVLRRSIAETTSDSELLVACAGADSARARRAAEALVETGAAALVSYGIAGGLAPGLEAGAVVLAESVFLPDGGTLATDDPWRRRLIDLAADRGDAVSVGHLIGSDRALRGVAEKRRVHEAGGAVAVDMESHAVAAVARDARVPFLVLRAVADPAARPLPLAVEGSITPEGQPRPGWVAARLAVRPWEVPGVLRLRRDAMAALRALGRVSRVFGAALTDYRAGP